jgi:two-component sensor histidine kinase
LQSCFAFAQNDQTDPIIQELEEKIIRTTNTDLDSADYLIATNQLAKAVELYRSALDFWLLSENVSQISYLSKRISDTYEKLGNKKLAFEYFQMHNSFADSAVNRENIENLKEVELNYAFLGEQLEDSIKNIQTIQALELDYQKEISNEQHTTNLFIFGLIIAAIIFAFIGFVWRRNKKQEIVFKEKNVEIEKALGEKQLLLKEVHHRVKNNFQIISSLLELQSKGIKDEKALELAIEGQSRVKTMALIHKRLYQNDELEIDFKDYLNQLVFDISSTFQHLHKAEVSVNAGDYFFDIDTAIPLGLIVNELVSNAYKYGFSNVDKRLVVDLVKDESKKRYALSIYDNGAGLPSDFDPTKAKSLGLRLVRRLAQQLAGSVKYRGEDGCMFTVFFKDTQERILVD